MINHIHIDPDLAAAELCKRPGGFKFFVQEMWEVIIAEDLVWAPHLDVLCDEMEKVIRNVAARKTKLHDLVVNIPPGTTKSTICTVMAPAWAWVVDDTLRIITGSYSADLATEHAVKSRDIIKSDKYQKYFPNVQIRYDKDNKTNYENITLGERIATSTGAGITGRHAHLIIIDDPLNPKQAMSQAECLTANNWMDKTLSTRKVDKTITPTVLIMQRLATNDPTGHLLLKKKENVRHICLPAELSNDVTPVSLRDIYIDGLLDPVRLPKKQLDEERINLGSDGYAGQYQQRPVQEGGLTWKKWLIEVDDAIFPPLKSMSQVGTDWDLAYTEKDTNSASAFITGGKIGNNAFIDDFGAVYFEFPELIKFMKSRRPPHYIEAKASGKSAKQTLVKNGIAAIEVKVQGGDKVARAKMATPYAEAGMVYIRKSLADRLYNDDRQGILNFPKNSHTDVADTLAQFIQRMFRGQIITASGEEDILDRIN